MVDIEKIVWEELDEKHKNNSKYSIFKKHCENITKLDKNVKILMAFGKLFTLSSINITVNELLKEDILNRIENFEKIYPVLRKYLNILPKDKYVPISRVREQLNLVDQSVFNNPKSKVFDPATGIGNFQTVLIEKFMEGLKDFEEDPLLRYEHIIKNVIYGSENNALFIHIYKTIFNPDKELDHNIFYGDFLSDDFTDHMENTWGIKQFNLVCGYPPQYENIDNNFGVKSIFPLYVNKILDNNLSIETSFVLVKRWINSGKKVEKFRNKILKRKDIKNIKTFDKAKDYFNNSSMGDIGGGILFINFDSKYNNKKKGVNYNDNIEFNIDKYNIFIETKYHSLIDKAYDKAYLYCDEIVKSKHHYNITKAHQEFFKDEKEAGDFLIYTSMSQGFTKYLSHKNIHKASTKLINGYKVFIPSTERGISEHGKFGKKIIGKPKEICTSAYITFSVRSEKQAENLISYMNTKFAQFFLSIRKNTQDIGVDTVKKIPLMDLNKSWTDEELYEHFEFSTAEIKLLEDKVEEKLSK